MNKSQISMSELVTDFVTDPLDPDLTVLSVFMLIKSSDESGLVAWSGRSGGAGISSEELLGALEGLVHSLRSDLAEEWE